MHFLKPKNNTINEFKMIHIHDFEKYNEDAGIHFSSNCIFVCRKALVTGLYRKTSVIYTSKMLK